MSKETEEQDELIQEFLVECRVGLDRLDRDLPSLARDPRNPEILASLFRTFHSIKGTAGFFAFEKLASVAHAAESLLSKLDDRSIVLDSDRADALLETVEILRRILSSIEIDRGEGDVDCTEVLDNLKRLQHVDPDVGLEVAVTRLRFDGR